MTNNVQAWMNSGNPELIHKAYVDLLESQRDFAADHLGDSEATSEEAHFYRGQLTAARAVLEMSESLRPPQPSPD